MKRFPEIPFETQAKAGLDVYEKHYPWVFNVIGMIVTFPLYALCVVTGFVVLRGER